MHPRQFDTLARLTSGAMSRRRSVLTLVGTALTSGVFGSPPVAAGCKKVGKKCDKNSDCCDGARCKGDTKDKKGKCRCKGSFTTCNKTCCSASKECFGGVCVTPPGGCAPGADSCAGEEDFKCGGSQNCECSQSTEGQTLCGDVSTPGAICGQCDSSTDCASFGPGAFCVASGSFPCCGPDAQNACRLPCAT